MKINELIGAKHTPAFQAAQKFDIDRSGRQGRGFEARSNLTKELAKLGWTSIGHGAFSEIYKHPSHNYILKVFSKDNRLWIEYFHYARQNQNNPHVPKIRGKLVKLSRTAYAVRMEKLEPVSHKLIMDHYIDPAILNDLRKRSWGITLEDIFSQENEDFLEENWPQLLNLRREVWDQIAYKNGDFDGEQWMARGKILVWIDPI